MLGQNSIDYYSGNGRTQEIPDFNLLKAFGFVETKRML